MPPRATLKYGHVLVSRSGLDDLAAVHLGRRLFHHRLMQVRVEGLARLGGDAFEIVPKLTEAIKNLKHN